MTSWHLRPAQENDVEAIVDVLNAASVAEGGEATFTIEELCDEWQDPTIDIARDTWVAVDNKGRIVGYEAVYGLTRNDHATTDGYVAPDATGQGIGRAMVRAAEARVLEGVQRPVVTIHSGVSGNNGPAHALFESEGYQIIRQFWRMEIVFDAPPHAPDWPAGIHARSFMRGQDEKATHDAIIESFSDHWGFEATPHEQWVQTRVGTEGFDPELWLLATEGNEIAGIALCRLRPGHGWVNTLGVRRAWRGRGLGMALLQHAFSTLYARGQRRVGLGVDAESLTGATRLYERAGMHIAERYDTFGKTVTR